MGSLTAQAGEVGHHPQSELGIARVARVLDQLLDDLRVVRVFVAQAEQQERHALHVAEGALELGEGERARVVRRIHARRLAVVGRGLLPVALAFVHARREVAGVGIVGPESDALFEFPDRLVETTSRHRDARLQEGAVRRDLDRFDGLLRLVDLAEGEQEVGAREQPVLGRFGARLDRLVESAESLPDVSGDRVEVRERHPRRFLLFGGLEQESLRLVESAHALEAVGVHDARLEKLGVVVEAALQELGRAFELAVFVEEVGGGLDERPVQEAVALEAFVEALLGLFDPPALVGEGRGRGAEARGLVRLVVAHRLGFDGQLGEQLLGVLFPPETEQRVEPQQVEHRLVAAELLGEIEVLERAVLEALAEMGLGAEQDRFFVVGIDLEDTRRRLDRVDAAPGVALGAGEEQAGVHEVLRASHRACERPDREARLARGDQGLAVEHLESRIVGVRVDEAPHLRDALGELAIPDQAAGLLENGVRVGLRALLTGDQEYAGEGSGAPFPAPLNDRLGAHRSPPRF